MAMNSRPSSRLTSIFARPFVLWGFGALATSLGVEWIFKHEELQSPATVILGFLPSLLAILFVLTFVRDIRKLDEMRRGIHMQAASISFLLIVILTFVFDGLKNAGIYRASLSDLDTATVLIWTVALIFLSVRYR